MLFGIEINRSGDQRIDSSASRSVFPVRTDFDGGGYTDYTGTTVLGAWHWLPELKWGVITEIDRDEGYGLAYNLHFIVNSILFAIAFPAPPRSIPRGKAAI